MSPCPRQQGALQKECERENQGDSGRDCKKPKELAGKPSYWGGGSTPVRERRQGSLGYRNKHSELSGSSAKHGHGLWPVITEGRPKGREGRKAALRYWLMVPIKLLYL
jgi:hypothetical protein